ncbi:hypothetical protein D910_10038 [Dendroctonus ponderosae]
MFAEMEESGLDAACESRKQSVITYGPVEIAHKGYRFLITMKPTHAGMMEYLHEMRIHNVQTVVKLCEENYDTKTLTNNGVAVLDMSFPDGKPPPDSVIEEWFKVLTTSRGTNTNACVAVHCVSGLGRAAVLVAIALIELGLKYEDAVEIIREKRRGAINSRQLEFLKKYKRRHRLENDKSKSCIIC